MKVEGIQIVGIEEAVGRREYCERNVCYPRIVIQATLQVVDIISPQQ